MKKFDDKQPMSEYLLFHNKSRTCECTRCGSLKVITTKNLFKQIKEMNDFKKLHENCDGKLK